LHGLNESDIEAVQQRLQHTGLQIIYTPLSNRSSSHFVIHFDYQFSSPIIIHKENMGYRYQLKPLNGINPCLTHYIYICFSNAMPQGIK